jgi:hypothetical protein
MQMHREMLLLCVKDVFKSHHRDFMLNKLDRQYFNEYLYI